MGCAEGMRLGWRQGISHENSIFSAAFYGLVARVFTCEPATPGLEAGRQGDAPQEPFPRAPQQHGACSPLQIASQQAWSSFEARCTSSLLQR